VIVLFAGRHATNRINERIQLALEASLQVRINLCTAIFYSQNLNCVTFLSTIIEGAVPVFLVEGWATT